jgi:nuclear pore complex protein Nup85
VLEEYIGHGQLSGFAYLCDADLSRDLGPITFAHLVADIAPSLQSLSVSSDGRTIFLHRLMFAVRYAEFHQRRLSEDIPGAAVDLTAMFEEDIVPKSWWAIVLCDSIEFLRYSEYLRAVTASTID